MGSNLEKLGADNLFQTENSYKQSSSPISLGKILDGKDPNYVIVEYKYMERGREGTGHLIMYKPKKRGKSA